MKPPPSVCTPLPIRLRRIQRGFVLVKTLNYNIYSYNIIYFSFVFYHTLRLYIKLFYFVLDKNVHTQYTSKVNDWVDWRKVHGVIYKTTELPILLHCIYFNE